MTESRRGFLVLGICTFLACSCLVQWPSSFPVRFVCRGRASEVCLRSFFFSVIVRVDCVHLRELFAWPSVVVVRFHHIRSIVWITYTVDCLATV